MKLLVCIAAHYAPERKGYLWRVLDNILLYYPEGTHIIIDTNTEHIGNWLKPLNSEAVTVEVRVHENLTHPFHLTQMHRRHFKDNLDNYDWFFYCEDDILLPWENFLAYTERFYGMWPNYIPSFVRIEEKDGERYLTDIKDSQPLNIIELQGKQFISIQFPQNYHAFWIMPQKELKENMKLDFTKLHEWREKAASYVIWELHKTGLLEIENGQIKEDCYAYHLPNNYTLNPDSLFGKLKVKEIFK